MSMSRKLCHSRSSRPHVRIFKDSGSSRERPTGPCWRRAGVLLLRVSCIPNLYECFVVLAAYAASQPRRAVISHW